MSWVDQKEKYEAVARQIDPSVRLTTKDGWIWRAIAWLLFLFSFGQFKRATFLTRYATTLGPLQAYPRGWLWLWDGIIVHESQHTAQARKFGLGLGPWAGLPLMLLVYGILFFPVGLAYFRYRLELDAERRSWDYLLENGMADEEYVYRNAERLAKNLSGPAYLWSWFRGSVRKGCLKVAEKVVEKHFRP